MGAGHGRRWRPQPPAAAEPVVEPAGTCKAEPDATQVYCAGAELAGQWRPVDHVRLPEGAVVLYEASAPDPARRQQRQLTVAVLGEELIVRKVTCGNCRRVLGEGFTGRLDLLAEGQVLDVQARLGLPEGPALRTAEAWRRYAEGAGREALDGVLGRP